MTVSRFLGSRQLVAGIALLIAIGGFVGHLQVAFLLDRLHVFDQANVLFDADPDEVLDTLAAGGYAIDLGGRHGFIHPGLRIFLTAPIKVVALALSTASSDAAVLVSWRRHLALFVAPASAALFYVVFFVSLRRLGASIIDACLLTTLACLSFGQLLFASIPESFPVSNAALALAFLLFVLAAPSHRHWRSAAWVAVGALAAGVTITNVVSVAILSWLDGIGNGSRPLRSAIKACGLGLAALGLILSLNMITNLAVGIRRPPSADAKFVTYYAERRPRVIATKLLTFPAVLVSALVPKMPQVVHDPYALQISARYPFRFTFDFDPGKGSSTHPLAVRNLCGVAGLVLMALGVARLRRASPAQRRACLLGFGSLAIIAFNWLFHSFWGGDRFLYSQHWQAALMLLAGTLWVQVPASAGKTTGLACVTLLVGINNVRVLAHMIDTIGGG